MPDQTTSAQTAEETLQNLLPDQDQRVALLRTLGVVIREAHRVNPASWSLTLSKERDYINLNVGRVFVLSFRPDYTRFAVSRGFRDRRPEIFSSWKPPAEDEDFAVVDATWFEAPHMEFLSRWDELRVGILEAVRNAAQGASRTPYSRFHSQDTVACVAGVIGEELPRPEHEGHLGEATGDTNRRLWVIRAGEEGQAHQQFVAGKLVGLGWDKMGDLSGLVTWEQILERFTGAYPEDPPPRARACAAEVFSLVRRIEVGDWVLYPVKASSEVLLGEITSQYVHAPDQVFSICRRVRWLRSLALDQLPESVRRSLNSPLGCFEVGEPSEDFWPLVRESEVYAAVASDFVSLLNGVGEASDEAREHRQQHNQRHKLWTELFAQNSAAEGALLGALKETDWFVGAKRNASRFIREAGGEQAVFRTFKRLVKTPPNTPSALEEIKGGIAGFGVPFFSEMLCCVYPDRYWVLNAPVEEAIRRLGFTGLDELPRGQQNPAHEYFALRPLQEGLRSAVGLAGLQEVNFLDVDLLLWELQKRPEVFPGTAPVLNPQALAGLIDDLRASHPKFTTFDDPGSTWWAEETGYKLELIRRFRLAFQDSAGSSSQPPGDLVRQLEKLMRAPLPPSGQPQNLIGWRANDLLRKVSAEPRWAEPFGEALRGLLYGRAPSDSRLQEFNDRTWPIVQQVPGSFSQALTRTLPTFVLMLQNPGEEILIRTDEFARVAKALTGDELFSDGPLSAGEYRRAKQFGRALFNALAKEGLRPRDLVDVQGFIYVVASRKTWICQANPAIFDLGGFLKAGYRHTSWTLPKRADEVSEGDEVYLWISGRDRGIVACGRLASGAIGQDEVPGEIAETERAFWRDRTAGPEANRAALIDLTQVFPDNPILARDLEQHPELKDLPILRQAAGTVFPVPKNLALALRRMLEERDQPMNKPTTFATIQETIRSRGLFFPADLLANYLVALQTKRFVILTGISGTGKTRLAMAVADCFGTTRSSKQAAELPDEAVMVTAAPYMFKYKRMVVPAALVQRADWPLTEGNRSMGRVLVEYDSSTTEQSFYRGPERPVTVLLFSAEVRSWFSDRFAVGDPVGLQLVEPEGGGLPRLRIFSPQNEETQEKVKNTEVVAVRPDWTDHRGLLGYYNPLIGQYVRTPFLALLMAAAQEEAAAQKAARPANPFFVILDEMNLARVEHYFSELLSCMESEQALHLHDDPGVEEGAVEEGIAVPREFRLPGNLFVVGTVNVDETTYMFSPKVLDRAFTIELNEVDLAGYSGTTQPAWTANSPLQLSGFRGLAGEWPRPVESDWKALGQLSTGDLRQVVIQLNEELKGYGRHFGYRVANEIARFVTLMTKQSPDAEQASWMALDLAILEKVLPKFHGTQQDLKEVLEAFFRFALGLGADSSPEDAVWDQWGLDGGVLRRRGGDTHLAPRLPRTAGKLWRMLRRLHDQGFVSYIE